MDALITADLEQDCPPYLQSWRGMEEGAQPLLQLLAAEGVPATLFATGEVGRRYRALLSDAVAQGHELGCHGDTHRRFDHMTREEARQDLGAATGALAGIAPVVSFRAPNLQMPAGFLPLLEEAGYGFDSSLAAYKPWTHRPAATALVRVAVSATSSVLRLPPPLRDAWLARLRSPVVLFVHPWEFVDFRRTRLRWDCRAGTGEGALAGLRAAIRLLKARGARFLKVREVPREPAAPAR